MTAAAQATTKAAAIVELAAKDLNNQGGVYCPSPHAGMQLWNTHPRVYINVSHEGQGRCAYCGTVYRLKAGEIFKGGH